MGRPARYIPENKDGVLVEVTCRAIGGRALLTPSPNPFKFNELVAGVLGRALEVSPLEICSVIFAGNHYHALLVVHDQQALSRFMAHVGCKVWASYCTSFLLSYFERSLEAARSRSRTSSGVAVVSAVGSS